LSQWIPLVQWVYPNKIFLNDSWAKKIYSLWMKLLFLSLNVIQCPDNQNHLCLSDRSCNLRQRFAPLLLCLHSLHWIKIKRHWLDPQETNHFKYLVFLSREISQKMLALWLKYFLHDFGCKIFFKESCSCILSCFQAIKSAVEVLSG
jgi:hypothetical protein